MLCSPCCPKLLLSWNEVPRLGGVPVLSPHPSAEGCSLVSLVPATSLHLTGGCNCCPRVFCSYMCTYFYSFELERLCLLIRVCSNPSCSYVYTDCLPLDLKVPQVQELLAAAGGDPRLSRLTQLCKAFIENHSFKTSK